MAKLFHVCGGIAFLFLIDANKALIQESDAASEMPLYYVKPELNPAFMPSGAVSVVSDAAFRKLGRMITDHIGDSEDIFVLDAAVGSHRLGEMNVRVITNSANVNLYLKHMLPRQGHLELWTFPYQLTVYVAPDLKLTSEMASLGLKDAQCSIVNLERGIVFVAGTTSLQAIREAITVAVTSRMLQDAIPSLGLNATVVTRKGKTALVIDPSNALGQLQLIPVAPAPAAATPAKNASTKAQDAAKSAKAKKSAESESKDLFTARLPEGVVGLSGAIWNHYGVFRMFQGITHQNEKVPRQRGDIVEKIAKTAAKGSVETTQITQTLKDLPNELASPSALVFLIADQNALLPSVAKLTPAQAAKFFSIGYNGASTESLTPYFHNRDVVSQPGQIDKVFQELLSNPTSSTPNTSTSVFLVNTKRKDGSALSQAEIDAIVTSATDGSLSSAKTEKDSVFKYDIITKLPGVSASLDITQGWANKQEYAAQASKLASILSA